jgi:hypothetical protein
MKNIVVSQKSRSMVRRKKASLELVKVMVVVRMKGCYLHNSGSPRVLRATSENKKGKTNNHILL